MPMYPFDATIKDTGLNIIIAEDIPVEVEVSVHVVGGTLETDIVDVVCDGKSLFVNAASPFTHALGQYIKAQALADLDSAGSLWSRVQEDLGLSFREDRGWRQAS